MKRIFRWPNMIWQSGGIWNKIDVMNACKIIRAKNGDKMNTVTATLDDDSMERLSKLAETTRRSMSWLVAEAIRNYLRDDEAQIAAIKEGIKAADNGQFASPREIKEAFARWGVDAG